MSNLQRLSAVIDAYEKAEKMRIGLGAEIRDMSGGEFAFCFLSGCDQICIAAWRLGEHDRSADFIVRPDDCAVVVKNTGIHSTEEVETMQFFIEKWLSSCTT